MISDSHFDSRLEFSLSLSTSVDLQESRSNKTVERENIITKRHAKARKNIEVTYTMMVAELLDIIRNSDLFSLNDEYFKWSRVITTS